MTVKTLKTNDTFKINGFTVDVSINKVLTFKGYGVNFEVWKDKNNLFHIGIVYTDSNNKEFRYRHFIQGEEPKKWTDKVNSMIDTYKEVYSSIDFTCYV